VRSHFTEGQGQQEQSCEKIARLVELTNRSPISAFRLLALRLDA
jgi:hypothetical protein